MGVVFAPSDLAEDTLRIKFEVSEECQGDPGGYAFIFREPCLDGLKGKPKWKPCVGFQYFSDFFRETCIQGYKL